jgi:hypothetical protein
MTQDLRSEVTRLEAHRPPERGWVKSLPCSFAFGGFSACVDAEAVDRGQKNRAVRVVEAIAAFRLID